MSSDFKQYKQYQEILKSHAPNTFAEFQNVKYNKIDIWEKLKTEKAQTVFVNNADCITTPLKFTGYFLKEGAKHAQEFFDVGYSSNNPLKLRYDIARQFDYNNAVNKKIDKNGIEKFNIFMELGITKKNMFCTGWMVDKPGDKPRIITAFRKDMHNGKNNK